MSYGIEFAKYVRRNNDGWDRKEASERFAKELHAFIELQEKTEGMVQEAVDNHYASNPDATLNKSAIVTLVCADLKATNETVKPLTERIEEYINSDRFMTKRGPGGSLARLSDEEYAKLKADPNFVPDRLKAKTEKKMSKKQAIELAVAAALAEERAKTASK
jgi:phage-related protein